MELIATTKRLRVFKASGIKPREDHADRDLFVAFRTDEDRPMPCATALIIDTRPWPVSTGIFLDWIEVTTEYRRERFATEMFDALEAYYEDRIEISPGSDDGRGWCGAIGERDLQ